MKYIASILLILAIGCDNPPPVAIQTTPMPNHVYVRGHEWNIVRDPYDDAILDMRSEAGETDCKRQDIFIRSHMIEPEQRNALLHELFHAGTCEDGDVYNLYWNSTSEATHEGIYRIADYLSDLLHENPDLTKYLAGE